MRTSLSPYCLLLLAGLPSLAAKTEPSANSDEALIGLWGVEQLLGPLVVGELTVEPANAAYNSRYASPVVLGSAVKNVWRGQVVPLEQRISFYVSMRRAPDGSLTALIRNPEFNWFRRRTFAVTLEKDAVVLTQDQQQLRGSYDEPSRTLTLPLLNASPSLRLTRRAENDAIGFYPRVPLPSGYVYQPPVAADDGWPTASLAEAGLDSKPIAQLIERILSANLEEDQLPMHSLLIARHGKLALEEYFYGYSRERSHDMRSQERRWPAFSSVQLGSTPPTLVQSRRCIRCFRATNQWPIGTSAKASSLFEI